MAVRYCTFVVCPYAHAYVDSIKHSDTMPSENLMRSPKFRTNSEMRRALDQATVRRWLCLFPQVVLYLLGFPVYHRLAETVRISSTGRLKSADQPKLTHHKSIPLAGTLALSASTRTRRGTPLHKVSRRAGLSPRNSPRPCVPLGEGCLWHRHTDFVITTTYLTV